MTTWNDIVNFVENNGEVRNGIENGKSYSLGYILNGVYTDEDFQPIEDLSEHETVYKFQIFVYKYNKKEKEKAKKRRKLEQKKAEIARLKKELDNE